MIEKSVEHRPEAVERERKRCAGCGTPAGRPSEGGKALCAPRPSRSVEEARSLPLYCAACNPRFIVTGALERMGD